MKTFRRTRREPVSRAVRSGAVGESQRPCAILRGMRVILDVSIAPGFAPQAVALKLESELVAAAANTAGVATIRVVPQSEALAGVKPDPSLAMHVDIMTGKPIPAPQPRIAQVPGARVAVAPNVELVQGATPEAGTVVVGGGPPPATQPAAPLNITMPPVAEGLPDA